jgi:hypothetical protein
MIQSFYSYWIDYIRAHSICWVWVYKVTLVRNHVVPGRAEIEGKRDKNL